MANLIFILALCYVGTKINSWSCIKAQAFILYIEIQHYSQAMKMMTAILNGHNATGVTNGSINKRDRKMGSS
jgi:hypothetical protein